MWCQILLGNYVLSSQNLSVYFYHIFFFLFSFDYTQYTQELVKLRSWLAHTIIGRRRKEKEIRIKHLFSAIRLPVATLFVI